MAICDRCGDLRSLRTSVGIVGGGRGEGGGLNPPGLFSIPYMFQYFYPGGQATGKMECKKYVLSWIKSGRHVVVVVVFISDTA